MQANNIVVDKLLKYAAKIQRRKTDKNDLYYLSILKYVQCSYIISIEAKIILIR